MNWKRKIKVAIPRCILNNFFLTFPFLYRTKLVCYETVLREGHGIDDLLTQLSMVLDIAGNIIECGSLRCGTSIIMANYLRSKRSGKIIYACDSFEGFDPIELDKEIRGGYTKARNNAFKSTSYEYVKRKIKKIGAGDMIVLINGFFKDTLTHIKSSFCFALVDCDLKNSIIYSAETIWTKLVSNGRMVFDDYTSEDFLGARLGIDFFVNKYKDEISEHGLMNRLYYVCKK